MQFLNEVAPLAALHITRHPMAEQKLLSPAKAGAHFTDPVREAGIELSVTGFEPRTSIKLRD
jgi:hypothetical protein